MKAWPANRATAVANGFSEADVLVSAWDAPVALAIRTDTLCLDLSGPDTNDLYALSWDDTDFSGTDDPGEAITISVRRESAVIPTLDGAFAIPIEE